MTDCNLGLYLHIPFCSSKCAYCDFYSAFCNEDLLNGYTAALIREIKQWGGKVNRPIDTVYFGGGTPSLLGHRLIEIMEAVNEAFKVSKGAEITLEMNPTADVSIFEYAKTAGVNRLSIGAQSKDNEKLKMLGRKHTAEDTEKTVTLARKFGFSNVSLDLMICLPDSTISSLEKDIDFIKRLNPEHISAYILKIEPKTAFYKKRAELKLPDDELSAKQYLKVCESFENAGYSHYEISNFAKKGYESRHNLKYWNLCEYLGIGPSAHSFLDGKRFFYPANLKEFINKNEPSFDSFGGGAEEYIMLKLRTANGLSVSELERKYNLNLSVDFNKKCIAFEKVGLLKATSDRIFLTDKGMLLSNSIITEFLECIL